jgi:hypothetical protein
MERKKERRMHRENLAIESSPTRISFGPGCRGERDFTPPYTVTWHHDFLEAKRENLISEMLECKGFGSRG